jgi:uncharacterized protein (DUF1015 family)
MATVIPFKGIRPTKDKVQLVASRSVDHYDKRHISEKLASNPFTFLHVINPDFTDKKFTKPGSKERLVKVKEKFEDFRQQGILDYDSEPCYYVYQQKKQGLSFTGIIAATSVKEYESGVIKKHEQTISDRELKLKEYLDIVDFNAEPVLFSYPNDIVIDEIIGSIIKQEPEYFFTTTDKVTHRLWLVKEKTIIKTIQNRFEAMPALYIADGHHRSSSSLILSKERAAQNLFHTDALPYNFYMGIFFSENQLKIYDFNRAITDLNGLSAEVFLEKLKSVADITEETKAFKPDAMHIISLYLNKKWYKLKIKRDFINDNDPVSCLDASILSELILDPILNIKDLKTDKRVYFVSGVKGEHELQYLVDNKKYECSFGLFPVSMKHLKWIADTDNIMPPKTTWIEPKMRSGMIIYSLTEGL